MPIDHHYEDDEKEEHGKRKRLTDFDCPSCNANNPADPPLEDGGEVLCNYCGTEFAVKISDEGKVKLREI